MYSNLFFVVLYISNILIKKIGTQRCLVMTFFINIKASPVSHIGFHQQTDADKKLNITSNQRLRLKSQS